MYTCSVAKNDYLVKDCLFVKQGKIFIKVKLAEITFLESARLYVTVYTLKDKYLVRSTLQNYLELLASPNFLRVHRSYAINTAYISAIHAGGILVNGREIPMSKANHAALLASLRLG